MENSFKVSSYFARLTALACLPREIGRFSSEKVEKRLHPKIHAAIATGKSISLNVLVNFGTFPSLFTQVGNFAK